MAELEKPMADEADVHMALVEVVAENDDGIFLETLFDRWTHEAGECFEPELIRDALAMEPFDVMFMNRLTTLDADVLIKHYTAYRNRLMARPLPRRKPSRPIRR